jgi:hypothetical protein
MIERKQNWITDSDTVDDERIRNTFYRINRKTPEIEEDCGKSAVSL